MLDERAASGHVEELHAAADGQDREAARVRLAGELELEPVEVRLDGTEQRVRLGAVGGGVEVGPAGQADPVEPVDQRLDRLAGIGGITSGRPPAASTARR